MLAVLRHFQHIYRLSLYGAIGVRCISQKAKQSIRNRRGSSSIYSTPIQSLCVLTAVFSRRTWVSRYQNVAILDSVEAKDNGGGGDNWTYGCRIMIPVFSSVYFLFQALF